MNAQHSAESSCWYTREEHLDAARRVLGPIDLDPASDEIGNRLVQARQYFTAEQDGLSVPWLTCGQLPITVWMNPPGTVRRKKGETPGPQHRPQPKLFWERLHMLRDHGLLRHAIVAAFSIEQLQVSQRWSVPMLAFPVCFPKSRVAWLARSGAASHPTHSSAFVYVPGTANSTPEFAEEFGRFGLVVGA